MGVWQEVKKELFVKSRQNVGSFLSYKINMSFDTLSYIGTILIFAVVLTCLQSYMVLP